MNQFNKILETETNDSLLKIDYHFGYEDMCRCLSMHINAK